MLTVLPPEAMAAYIEVMATPPPPPITFVIEAEPRYIRAIEEPYQKFDHRKPPGHHEFRHHKRSMRTAQRNRRK